MKTLLTLLLCPVSAFGLAQNYSGIVGKSYVVMHIERSGSKVSGYYFYQNFGTDISLSGKATGSEMILNESINAKTKAVFTLKLSDRKILKGSWTDAATKKSLPVVLKPKAEPIPEIPKNIAGIYESDSVKTCPMRIEITKKDGSYRYHLKNHTLDKSGKVGFDRDLEEQSVFIIFKGIEWAENEGELDNDGNPKYKTGLPTDIDAVIEDDSELIIQNYGNSMNYYVKFANCDEKYIHLTKK